jgi:nucleotide-binding universal stress UspA family protein
MVMLKPKNILVPVDFSAQSEQSLKAAMKLATEAGARVYALHVIASSMVQCIDDYCLGDDLVTQMGSSRSAQSTDDYAVTDVMVKQMDALLEKKATDMMAALLRKIRGSMQVKLTPIIKKGVPYEVILDEAKKKSIDMIIIPPHGKASIKDFFLGSTVDKVVRQAKCTVIVAR